MFLNIVQIAESFGVSEKVVEDWVRREQLPHTPDGGRLLFDREQVATWAAARGLAARAGLLARGPAASGRGFRLATLLRAGGIWRDIAAADVTDVLSGIIAALPGTTPALRRLLAQRLRAPGGVTFSPVGDGFALPQLSARVALGRDSGTLALLLLRGALRLSEPSPDTTPVTRLFFLIAPSPRAHLDLLGRLSRSVMRGPLREAVERDAADEELFRAMVTVDEAATAVSKQRVTS